MMAAAQELLEDHRLVDTHAVDEARQAIGRIFCQHFLDVRGAAGGEFHAVHNAVQQPGYSVNFVAYGAEVEIDPGELSNFFLLQLPVRGSASVRCGTQATDVSAGRRASLLSPTLHSHMVWRAGCQKLIVLIRRQVVEDFFETLTHQPRSPIEFEPSVNLEGAVGRNLLSHARLMFEAAEDGAGIADTYRLLLRDGLISLLLTGLSNNRSNAMLRSTSNSAPIAVRKAEDYIRAHAEKDIAMADIAAAAGIPLRTLQDAYRNAQGYTLTDGVQRARLENLRKLLLHPSPSLSVADAVFASGFGHLGRAASAYRNTYGENPSETLQRARGR